MSLILDALKRARQLAQGRNASPQAQNLMNSFGFSQRAKRKRTRKLVLYIVPAVILAAGIAFAANLYLKKLAQSSITVAGGDTRAANVPAAALEPLAPPPADQTTEKVPSDPAEIKPDPAQPAATAATPPKAAPAPPPAKPAAASTRRPVVNSTPAPPPKDTQPIANREQTAAAPPPPANQPAPSAVPAAAPVAPPTPAATPITSVTETSERDPHDAMVAYLRVQNFPKALEECKKALVKYPGNAGTQVNCGAAYIGLNMLDEALGALNSAIRLGSSSEFLFSNLGVVYMKQEDFRSALGAFERAAALNDKNAVTLYNKGLAHKKLGSVEKAKADFLKAAQINPKYAEAHLNLALIYDAQGELGRALESYRSFYPLAAGLPDFRLEVAHASDRIKELESKIPKPD